MNMPGGYLRILYPAPEVCLDLQSWQEFYGFDLNGQEGCLNVTIDTEALTMVFEETKLLPRVYPHDTGKRKYICSPDEITKSEAKPMVQTDFFGVTITSQQRLPGPFTELNKSKAISIDPRIKRRLQNESISKK